MSDPDPKRKRSGRILAGDAAFQAMGGKELKQHLERHARDPEELTPKEHTPEEPATKLDGEWEDKPFYPDQYVSSLHVGTWRHGPLKTRFYDMRNESHIAEIDKLQEGTYQATAPTVVIEEESVRDCYMFVRYRCVLYRHPKTAKLQP